MHKLFQSFGFSVAGIGAVLAMGAANAAESGRAAYSNINSVNSRVGAVSSQRMPTMPTLPGNSTGNLNPGLPNNGGNKPTTNKCPNGAVENSDYTVDMCMNDVLACVNNGALPRGLNDLFNEDLRNSIMNGMGLCSVQVEKCVATVRKNCANVYHASSDVWIDFNSRKIQPEYYSFVLRKTGLTPNQAENTCWLLDKNTFGSSFAAVGADGKVTSEYAGAVGAYNNQGGNGLTKTTPQGKDPNKIGDTDAERGHYARWDATTGECLIRVAAYNKDSHIKNDWLFGSLGDDKPAEVWESAGDTFSCNKDLFGFSLMNKTSTAAVVGIGGGTLAGAGVGALVGHGKRALDCENKSQMKELSEQIRAADASGILGEYIGVDVSGDKKTAGMGNGGGLATTGAVITKTQCENLIKLYNVYQQAKVANTECNLSTSSCAQDGCPSFRRLNEAMVQGTGVYCDKSTGCLTPQEFKDEIKRVAVLDNIEILKGEDSNMLKTTLVGTGIGAATGGLATAITAFVEKNNINCRVGDGLEKVGFGKSYHIGSLKDFYVKWNLRLPDTIMPTAQVVDCVSWKNACATLTDLNQCAIAQINYKPANTGKTTLVNTACVVSGSACIENDVVAKSVGACEYKE